jgi:hypothetical protein
MLHGVDALVHFHYILIAVLFYGVIGGFLLPMFGFVVGSFIEMQVSDVYERNKYLKIAGAILATIGVLFLATLHLFIGPW